MNTQSPRDRILAEVAAVETRTSVVRPAETLIDAVNHAAAQALSMIMRDSERGDAVARAELVKIAGWAIAAIEAIDAQGETK